MTRSSPGRVRETALTSVVALSAAAAVLVTQTGWASAAVGVGLAISRTGTAAQQTAPSALGPAGPAPRSWRLTASQHYGGPRDASGFSAVVAPTRRDAWVFGGTNPGGASVPVTEHWTGQRWLPVPLPSGLGSFISGASASGPANVWAYSSFGGYVLHWDGTRWLVARRWHPVVQATGVTVLSPHDVWLFGAPGPGIRGTGTWRFNGRRWSRLTGPGTQVYRASAVSRHDIWGITASPGGGRVEHWNGRQWRVVPTGRALTGTHLDDLAAVRGGDVWVVGNSPAGDEAGRVVVAHWNGRSWHRTVIGGHVIPRRMVPDGAGGVWIAAMTLGGQTESRLVHLSRSGHITATDLARGLGNAVSDLALIPGGRSLWGSGGFLTASGGDAAIWRYQYDQDGPAGPARLPGAGPSADPA